MKKEVKKVPQLRFPEFTGDWEQRKFSELVTIERGGSPRPIDKFITNDENGLNWVKIGDAPEHGNYITQTAEKIRPEGLSKTREVHPGDLILSNSMSFGRPYIMAIDGCIHDGWLAIRDTKKNFDLKFLCTLLGTDGMLNQYKAMAAGSTVNNLNKELVGGTTVAFPIMEEQIKIGDYFTTIDHLITLHQRKLEKIKKFKKGVMQKLFSQEIRFKADDGSEFPEWKEKTFHEVIKLYRGSSPRPIVEYIVDDNQGLNWIKISDVPQNGNVITTVKEHISKEGAEKSRAVYKGEIILSNSMSFGKPCILGIDGFIHDGWFVIREYEKYLNKWYLCQLLNSDIMYKQYRRLAAGGVVLNISSEIVNSTKIPVPCLSEQQKIADCLSSLDEVIEKQKATLAAWKELKKGLLQQMFV